MVALGPVPISAMVEGRICSDDDDVSGKLGCILSLRRWGCRFQHTERSARDRVQIAPLFETLRLLSILFTQRGNDCCGSSLRHLVIVIFNA